MLKNCLRRSDCKRTVLRLVSRFKFRRGFRSICVSVRRRRYGNICLVVCGGMLLCSGRGRIRVSFLRRVLSILIPRVIVKQGSGIGVMD